MKIDRNSDVKIYGRGVLSSAKMNYREHHAVEAINGSNRITIEGLVVADPKYFAIRLIGTDNIVNYTKVIGGWVYNCDGIPAFKGSRVNKCFIWANDDAIKIYRDNIVWEDIVVWQLNNGGVIQTSWGGAIGGSHNIGDTIRRLDVLRAEWNEGRNDDFNCGLLNMVGNRYEDVGRTDLLDDWLIEDVVTETNIPQIFNLAPHDFTVNKIEGLTLRNWRVKMKTNTKYINHIEGHSGHNFKGLVFDNVYFNGTLLTNKNCLTTGFMNSGGWSAVPKTTNLKVTLQNDVGTGSSKGLKSVVTNMGGGNHYIIRASERIAIDQGDKITISFWAKAASGTPRLVSWLQETDSNEWMNVGDHILNTSWKKYTATVTMDKVSSTNYEVKFRGYENATIYIDNVRLGPENWQSVLDAKIVNTNTPTFLPDVNCSGGVITTTENTQINLFTVYPNPAHSSLEIIGIDDKVKYSVLNTTGKTVLQDSGTILDISNLPTGMYFLITDENQSVKFVKE